MAIHEPTKLKYSQIKTKLSLSPSNYEEIVIANTNCKSIRQLIGKNFKKGKEVGSNSYISESKKYFLRTKALQQDSFLLEITKESAIPIKPQSFINHKLTKGKILISKDSNIGEVAYLEKDYPEYMLSAGLISIEVPQHPFYVLAFLKNNFFKAQLNAMISPGTIIKHAKTLFLDCKIPFPNFKSEESMRFIEEITKAIIRRESNIHNRYQQISRIFEQELLSNCKNKDFSNYFPKYSEIMKSKRLDTGTYEREYQRIIHCIETYKQGSFKIPSNLIKSGSTPKNRILGRGFKKWVTPTIFDELGYFTSDERIHCKENNITKDCVIIKNRTLKEKLGRFVGTAAFYDFEKLGLGHHNQGCYRVEDFPSDKLKYIALVLNTQLYRKMCGYQSLGSKMREIKIDQFASIPFPELDEKTMKNLISLYDNDVAIPEDGCVLIEELATFDLQNINRFGILQLASQMHFLQKKLNVAVRKIVNDNKIDFDLNRVEIQ